jgi:hypothetical protein
MGAQHHNLQSDRPSTGTAGKTLRRRLCRPAPGREDMPRVGLIVPTAETEWRHHGFAALRFHWRAQRFNPSNVTSVRSTDGFHVKPPRGRPCVVNFGFFRGMGLLRLWLRDIPALSLFLSRSESKLFDLS